MPLSNNDFDASALSYDHVQSVIRQHIPVVGEAQAVPLAQAHQRILAQTIRAQEDIPGYSNSAVDGYAFAAHTVQSQRPVAVIGRSSAGHPFMGEAQPGSCVRITTGAMMPHGTDTVVMQENVMAHDAHISIQRMPQAKQNVRYRGEDLKAGDRVCGAGKRLAALDIATIASCGLSEVTVFRRPSVAIFSTGDEVRPVGEKIQAGQVYDSNRFLLREMLHQSGASCLDLGIIQDDPVAVADALSEASQADMLITSAGISVGDADFLSENIQKLGRLHFWKTALKPGRPLAFGTINCCPVFALPGNPVSVAIMFCKIVLPALRRLMGEEPVPEPLQLRARLDEAVHKRPGRMEYQRGCFEQDSQHGLVVRTFKRQGSALLNELARSNCLIVLPEEVGHLAAGAEVAIEPIGWPMRSL